jgi:hypothetical protein
MIGIIRSLRALTWLRWRLLKNSVSGARKRDSLEQVSRALALVVPLLILVMSIGTFVAISVVGFVGGRMMATGVLEMASGLLVLRLLLGLIMFAIVALAVVSPAQSTLSLYTRLLLLPIPLRLLHLVESRRLGDPWVAVVGGTGHVRTGRVCRRQPLRMGPDGGQPDDHIVVCAAALAAFLSRLMRDRHGLFARLRHGVLMLAFIPRSRHTPQARRQQRDGRGSPRSADQCR